MKKSAQNIATLYIGVKYTSNGRIDMFEQRQRRLQR